MSDEAEAVSKQKRRKKVKKKIIRKSSATKENVEINDEDTNDTEQDIVSTDLRSHNSSHSSPEHRRHSRRKSSTGKAGGKNAYPHTIITAVLEELAEDMVDETPRDDAGENTETIVQMPVSLPPDKVYVERKNGFAVTPRTKMFQSFNNAENSLMNTSFTKSITSPLELAILIQKCCRPIYTLCHGLLGGMALLHIILVYGAGEYFNEEKNFVNMYTSYSRVYQSMFHILSILCFISVMDRCDVKHMDISQFVDMFRFNLSTVSILTVYFVTVILTFVTTKWDDWLSLASYNDTEEYLLETNKLKIWKNLNLCRNMGAISGWVLIALFPADDMLHIHLCNMMKYQPMVTRAVPMRY
ncbi:hypothetical protein L9F63_017710 [Diploptera punctata]|uniref:Uncharacterized protein n=1 Tax=Diploptera punctata TaxID=6984 RepID=A0AAD8EFW4_DIPPU|nr:hypothetical protein L9F63_017710 [Diploptera punctata]